MGVYTAENARWVLTNHNIIIDTHYTTFMQPNILCCYIMLTIKCKIN